MKKIIFQQKGQALVTLLFFMVIAVTITSAAVVLIATNSLAASRFEQGTDALDIAESGVENALLRLDRDPSYTGETLNVGTGTVTISVSLGNPTIITATGSANQNNATRTIQVNTVYNNGALTVTSWKELY